MESDSPSQTLSKQVSRVAGGLVIAAAIGVLLGWTFDIVALKGLWPGLATMKANNAFCFALAGVALCLSTLSNPGRWRWSVVRLCALIILLISALSVAEDVFGFNAGIDQLLFRDLASERAPGRMSPVTAFNWIAVSAALMLMATKSKRWRALAQWPVLLVALAALVAVAGYIYSVQQLYKFGPYASVALHTAMGFLVVATGLLWAPPHGSLVTLLRSRRLGGTVARVLLPVAICLPLVGGWIRLEAQRQAWVGTDLGAGLFATGLAVMLVGIVWVTARAIEVTDVRRERAVRALHDRERRIRNIFEQATDGIFLLSADNRYLDANPAGAAMLGYTRDELLQMSVADVLSSDERDRLNFESAEMMAGKPHLAEWEHLRKDGTRFPAEVSARKLNDQTYLAIVRDLTSRRRAEAELRASERRFRELLENVDLIAVLLDVEGRVTFCNDYLLRLTGYSLNDVIGIDWFDKFVPEQRPDVKQNFLTGLRGGAVSKHFENPIQTRSGELRSIAWNNTVLRDTDGNVIGTASIGEDITERKLANEKVRLSEKKFSDAFQTSPAGITITRIADGRFIDVNEAFLRMFEFTREEVIGRTSIELNILRPEERERLIAAQVESGGLRNTELSAHSKSGKPVNILFSSKPIAWEGETHHITTLIDISDRKQAEAALRETEEHLESALAAGSVGTWVWDLVNNRGFADAYLSELFSIKNDSDAEGEALDIFFQAIDEEDRPRVQDAIERTIKFDEKYDVEFRVLPADMKPRWLHGRGRIERDAAGNALRFLGMLMDITDRKFAESALRESEEKFRALADHSIQGIVLFQDERTTFVNPACCAITGFSREEILAQTATQRFETVHPDDRARVIERQQRFERGQPIEGVDELRIRRKDGEERWVLASNKSFMLQGKPARLEIIVDITDRKRAEEELRASSEQLHALSARLLAAREEEGTRIAREIHDELGGVLTGLKWDLEDCAKVLSPSSNGEPVASIRKKIPVMTGLLDATIDTVRRISSELRPGVLDDLGLIAAIEWQGQQFQQRTGIECRCDAGLDTIELSREQATAIFRVFQEVLTNVLRHAQATRVEVKMSEGDGELVLEVKDNGRGISESDKQNTRSLGLLGMRERVQLIGGEIDISGAKGKGTRVVVRVPLE